MAAPRWAAVVTAAGSSARMGGTKKEFRALDGVPVLALAVRPFADAGARRIVVTLPPGRLEEARRLLDAHLAPGVPRLLVEGGPTRQESVRRGLAALADDPPDLVLVHDGARPWLSAGLLARVLEAAARFGACVPVLEAAEAVKEIDPAAAAGDGGMVGRHLPRHAIALAQTPQGFAFAALVDAHERARAAGACFVDDAEVYDRFAGRVAWVRGDPANRKITFAGDLEDAP